MQPDLIKYIEQESKNNGLTQSQYLRLACKSLKKDTLEKVREVRELLAA